MFKYISNILSTITPGQRLIALCFLLLSVVTITVAPKLIDATTNDTEELTTKVNLQRTEITSLSARVKELNDLLINNESECTNRLIDKEKRILSVIDELERDLAPSISPRKEQLRRVNYESYEDSNTVVMRMEMPRPLEPEPVQMDNSKALKKLKNLKLDLTNDLKKSQN